MSSSLSSSSLLTLARRAFFLEALVLGFLARFFDGEDEERGLRAGAPVSRARVPKPLAQEIVSSDKYRFAMF